MHLQYLKSREKFEFNLAYQQAFFSAPCRNCRHFRLCYNPETVDWSYYQQVFLGWLLTIICPIATAIALLNGFYWLAGFGFVCSLLIYPTIYVAPSLPKRKHEIYVYLSSCVKSDENCQQACRYYPSHCQSQMFEPASPTKILPFSRKKI